MRPKAKSIEVKDNYILLIEFDNGEKRYFDVKPYFEKKAFEGLKNINMFKTVKIGGLSIEWDNGVDICPDELYNNSFR